MTAPSMPDFTPLHTQQDDFQVVVKCAVESEGTHAPRVDLLFVRFREATPDDKGLAEVVYHQVVNYALPKRKVKELLASAKPGDFSAHSKLLSEARRAFIAYNSQNTDPRSNIRYAEIGEVIAFCVASHFLNAGQVAAKMALKTNSEMPVFGLDGIHVKAESDANITVYFLEAKMVGDAESGASQYAKSAAGFAKDRAHELNEKRIARDLSNLDLLEAAARASAIEYFDPYGEKQTNVRERFVGIIIHSESAYSDKLPVNDATPLEAHQSHFSKRYSESYPKLSESLKKSLKSAGVEPGKCRTFFLAVPDTETLKQLFAKEMTGEHIR